MKALLATLALVTPLLAAALLAPAPAQAQNRVITSPNVSVPYQGVPGQNMAPPAPRQNLSPPPPKPPRPGEGDSNTRIQNDYNTRMPTPANPGQ